MSAVIDGTLDIYQLTRIPEIKVGDESIQQRRHFLIEESRALHTIEILRRCNETEKDKITINRKSVFAAIKGDVKEIATLQLKGAEFDYVEMDSNFLFELSLYGSLDGSREFWYSTPLMAAAAKGQIKVLGYMLDNNHLLNINYLGYDFNTALSFAVRGKQEKMVGELLRRKAQADGIIYISAADMEGKKPCFPSLLTLSCLCNPSFDIARNLIAANARIKQRFLDYDDGYNTALGHILFNSNLDSKLRTTLVNLFLENGAQRLNKPPEMSVKNYRKKIEQFQREFPNFKKIAAEILATLNAPASLVVPKRRDLSLGAALAAAQGLFQGVSSLESGRQATSLPTDTGKSGSVQKETDPLLTPLLEMQKEDDTQLDEFIDLALEEPEPEDLRPNPKDSRASVVSSPAPTTTTSVASGIQNKKRVVFE